MPNVVMRSVIMLNVTYKPYRLSVVTLNVVLLSVVAPKLGGSNPARVLVDIVQHI